MAPIYASESEGHDGVH